MPHWTIPARAPAGTTWVSYEGYGQTACREQFAASSAWLGIYIVYRAHRHFKYY